MDDTEGLVFYVNGRKQVENHPDPEENLLSYLRYNLRWTGSKAGCGEGGCGACTVMISECDKKKDTVRHYAANACLIPLCSLHGLAVTTVEGIGSTKTRLHPVQERLAEAYGSQCGFCTPGMVMSMYALLRNHPQPSEEDIIKNLDGNLCRCTGYRSILNGFKTFAKGECGMGKDCCRNGTYNNENGEFPDTNGLSRSHIYPAYDPTQEPIFPPELKNKWSSYHEKSMVFKNDNVTWYRPVTLQDLLELKSSHPEAKIIIGNTEIGIETRFKGQTYPVQIHANHVSELKEISWTSSSVTFGAGVTFTDVIETLDAAVKDMPEAETRVYRGMLDVLKIFGGTQIRNVSSIGGNIMTASPLSDLNPLLMAAGAKVKVARKGAPVRKIKMDANFFPGYRTTCLTDQDVLLSVIIPKSNENEFYHAYKQAGRREDDITIVNAGMKVEFEDGTDVVKNLQLAYGGMANTTIMATKTMNVLCGSRWEKRLVTKATSLLAEELALDKEVPGGMSEYKQSLAVSFFFKFFLSVQLEYAKQKKQIKPPVPMSFRSAVTDLEFPPPTTSYLFAEVDPYQTADDTVGRPILHDSGIQHATGEAAFLDDVVPRKDELFMALVVSEKAHAVLLDVDPSEALLIPGVVDYISSTDIPGKNNLGLTGSIEEVFATKKVHCKGQTIGAIVADDRETAKLAAAKVKVTYEELEPILTIKEAIKQTSFYGDPVILTSGDPQAALGSCDHVLEGQVRTGAQEHFYMETMASLVIPGAEDGRIEVHTGTQITKLAQSSVSEVLGVPSNKVVVRVKRVGGAFGGKQVRNLLTTLPAAVAAHKLGRPVRCVLERNVDMMITGTRHPLWSKYTVGFNDDGKIHAFCPNVYVNGGMSQDYTVVVLHKQKFHVDSCYNIPNICFTGNACRTNIPSNTAFRGFGIPQIAMVTERMIQSVAEFLDKPPEHIRCVNMYSDGDFTHFKQELSPCTLNRCWEECMQNSSFDKRRREVDTFNSENRWKKRGLSMTPVKYGLTYPATANPVNQASALVHIYLDGSVLVSHGGVEMGQGIHVKMIQIASRVLQVPTSFIHIDENSTDKIHNASPTAASASADLQGNAVKDACQILYDRIKPYIKENQNGTWKDWVNAAYCDRVQLMATGFYRYPDLHYDPSSDRNVLYGYFVYGVGCSEVEIDCLTGEHHVISTDLVVDAGKSLNPAIDIGQIEGAFLQAYGLYCLEEYKVSPDGTLLSSGPSTYKIPTIGDIPTRLSVHLLQDSDNPRAIYGSKGVAEPPMILALSVFFAINDAIKSARADAGLTEPFQLDCPATPEVIRLGCQDQFTKNFPVAPEGNYKPWTVKLS